MIPTHPTNSVDVTKSSAIRPPEVNIVHEEGHKASSVSTDSSSNAGDILKSNGSEAMADLSGSVEENAKTLPVDSSETDPDNPTDSGSDSDSIPTTTDRNEEMESLSPVVERKIPEEEDFSPKTPPRSREGNPIQNSELWPVSGGRATPGSADFDYVVPGTPISDLRRIHSLAGCWTPCVDRQYHPHHHSGLWTPPPSTGFFDRYTPSPSPSQTGIQYYNMNMNMNYNMEYSMMPYSPDSSQFQLEEINSSFEGNDYDVGVCSEEEEDFEDFSDEPENDVVNAGNFTVTESELEVVSDSDFQDSVDAADVAPLGPAVYEDSDAETSTQGAGFCHSCGTPMEQIFSNWVWRTRDSVWSSSPAPNGENMQTQGRNSLGESSAPRQPPDQPIRRTHRRRRRKRRTPRLQKVGRDTSLASNPRWTSRPNLFVFHLHWRIRNPQLKALFEPFGTIVSSRVIYDDHGVSRGYGFVMFSSRKESDAAISVMNGFLLQGKRLAVSYKTIGADEKRRHRRNLKKKRQRRNATRRRRTARNGAARERAQVEGEKVE